MSNLDLRTFELKRNAWEAKARGRLQTKAKREMAANSLLRRNITTTIRRMVTGLQCSLPKALAMSFLPILAVFFSFEHPQVYLHNFWMLVDARL